MTLSFKTHMNGHRTWFPEKIMWSRKDEPITIYEAAYFKSPWSIPGNISDFNPKLHTIRKGNRWRKGMDIHFVINNRTKDRLQFLPVIPCTKVDEISIDYMRFSDKAILEAIVSINGERIGSAIWSNCQLINSSYTVDLLAVNDGFESTNDFFEYFNEDFEGQIIHWTEGLDYLNWKEVRNG